MTYWAAVDCGTTVDCDEAHLHCPFCLMKVSVQRSTSLKGLPSSNPFPVHRPVTTAASPYRKTRMSSSFDASYLVAPDFRLARTSGFVRNWPSVPVETN